MDLRPSYIAPSELAAALRSTETPPPVVIDVRDVDFAGGHIRSAVNIPEYTFRDDAAVDEIVERFRDARQIVFHCMLSQVRGPTCAKRFLSRLGSEETRPDVKVLVGGYARFSEV
jgi:rhodanese-related sulfurtransferase